MSTDKTAYYQKGNGFLALLGSLWGMLKVFIFIFIVAFVGMEVVTPSLNYSSSAPSSYRSASPAAWVEPTDALPERSFRTTLTTHDYRQLQVDYFAPANFTDTSVPLTIIVAGFAAPEWLLGKVRPRGNNAVVIYRSPRLSRMLGDLLPGTAEVGHARTAADYWNIIATNPFNHFYNVHAGLHEAPGDIVDIVKWAAENTKADINRINIIGIGTGSLVAAAAARGLQVSGTPARNLALVFPPANLQSAITDNLPGLPPWLRAPTATALDFLYMRLSLSRHLPAVLAGNKLIVIPENSFDLAAYAAEPAIAMAGPHTTVERIDLKYNSFLPDTLINQIRDKVGNWLIAHGGISSY